MRVAYLSPLPPQRSGIADYSAELIPHLAGHVELELFTDRPAESRQMLGGEWAVDSVERFGERRDEFDVALYHLGNNPEFHGSIHAASLEHPGVVALHEYMLHHLIQGLTLARHDVDGYVEAMRYCYGRGGERQARRHLETGVPIDVWRYPLFERIVDRSLGLIVHNRTTRDRILASRPDADIAVVPHHLALERLPEGEEDSMRRRFGIPEEAFVVASFGFVTPQKRLEVSLRAFAELHRERPGTRYLIAGEISPYYDLEAVLEETPSDGVVVTGRLELDELLAAMRTCDVAVNLRYPSGGETSGTLMRLLGLGKAVVVSDHGSFAEVPDGCCAKLPVDEREVALLSAYLRRLEDDDELRRALGRNARRHMAREHTLAGSAAAYSEVLERLASAPRAPFRAAPPLLARDERPVYGALVEEVGRATADLGVGDVDLEVIGALAEDLVALGFDREGHDSGETG